MTLSASHPSRNNSSLRIIFIASCDLSLLFPLPGEPSIMDIPTPTEEQCGLLFLLEDPVVLLDNGEQAMAIFVADDARYKMKASMTYKQFSQTYENGRPSKKHRASTGCLPNPNPLKRSLDIILVDEKELRAFANGRNVKLKCEQLLRDLVDVSSPPLPTNTSESFAPHPAMFPVGAFPTMLDTGPHRTGVIPQRGITTRENNSLLRVDPHNPSEFRNPADYMYALRLRLVPEDGNPRHAGLSVIGVSGRIYEATIDTGDSTFWLYQRGFRQIEGHGEDTWDEDPSVPKITVPEGPKFSLIERAKIKYSDNGWCGLRRWDFEYTTLPLEVPSWNWKTNSQGRVVLDFPRVLADRANKIIIRQPYDGNLGLAVPGWRHPWSDEIEPEDRTTFFDVLVNEGKQYVDTPSLLTLRLLWPRPAREIQCAPERIRSFLYFGNGYPCGIPGPNGKLIAPQFGPKIFIEESYALNSFGERQFTHWTLRLLSMTLLVPTVLPPNYSSANAPDWRPIPIAMPDMDGLGGVRANLDTCAARTYLPDPVIQAMRTLWFKLPPDAVDPELVFGNSMAFENCDIVFSFKGDGTDVIDFRCNAMYFLASPWRMRLGYVAPFATMATPPEGIPPTATLGLNFFWSAIVRLDGTHRGNRPIPGVARPYVQLAPQRIVQDGRRLAGPWDIGIHEDAPPRVQAAARKQPELFTT